LGVLARPQWAIAAAAALVMAISLPFILSNKGRMSLDTQSTAPAAAAASSEQSTASQPRESQTPSDKTAAQAADGLVAVHQAPSAPKTEAQSKNSPVEAIALNEAPQREADSKKLQAQESTASKDDSRSAAASGAVAQHTQVAAAKPEVARDDESRRQQTEKEKASEQPTKSEPTDQLADKTKRERAEEIPPPPAAATPAPSADSPRKDQAAIGKTRAKLAFGSGSSTEAAKASVERKVSGKKFVKKDGAWIDKDYDPDKDLPAVTIVRDSNVYKEVLSKRPGLKPYLAGFAPTDRATIVYKGTVYNFIPQ
jgi:hypothetical protein